MPEKCVNRISRVTTARVLLPIVQQKTERGRLESIDIARCIESVHSQAAKADVEGGDTTVPVVIDYGQDSGVAVNNVHIEYVVFDIADRVTSGLESVTVHRNDEPAAGDQTVGIQKG